MKKGLSISTIIGLLLFGLSFAVFAVVGKDVDLDYSPQRDVWAVVVSFWVMITGAGLLVTSGLLYCLTRCFRREESRLRKDRKALSYTLVLCAMSSAAMGDPPRVAIIGRYTTLDRPWMVHFPLHKEPSIDLSATVGSGKRIRLGFGNTSCTILLDVTPTVKNGKIILEGRSVLSRSGSDILTLTDAGAKPITEETPFKGTIVAGKPMVLPAGGRKGRLILVAKIAPAVPAQKVSN